MKVCADNVNRHMKLFVIEIVLLPLVLSGCGLMTPVAYNRLPTYTFTPARTIAPTAVLHTNFTPTPITTHSSLETVSPTETVSLTETVNLTETVTPTIIPGVLDCNMISSKHINGMTDLQWAEYTRTVIDKKIFFSGRVYNVEINGVVVLIGANQQCNFEVYNIPLKQAAKINKDQYMEGYGAISAIDFSDVALIHLNVLLDSLVIR